MTQNKYFLAQNFSKDRSKAQKASRDQLSFNTVDGDVIRDFITSQTKNIFLLKLVLLYLCW